MAALLIILAVCAVLQPCLGGGTNAQHCIKMTKEKEDQIHEIVEKIGNFLNELATHYDDLDITLVKFDVEQHSEDEVEEKDTQLHVAINDCAETIDTESDGSRQSVKSRVETRAKAQSIAHSQIRASQNGNRRSQTFMDIKKPRLMIMKLGQPGQEIIEALEKKRSKPLLVYVQKNETPEYVFLNK